MLPYVDCGCGGCYDCDVGTVVGVACVYAA